MTAAGRTGPEEAAGMDRGTPPGLLDGRVAVVTGVGRWIGRAIAIGYARAAADVAVLGRRPGPLRDTATEIAAVARRALVIPVDVIDARGLEAALDRILDEFGTIDCLVNTAGTTHRGPTEEVTLEDWNEVLTTNLTETFLACRVFGSRFLRVGGGSILNIASLVAQLTRQLAVEWAARGVLVDCLMPGFIRTPMLDSLLASGRVNEAQLLDRTPMRRFGETAEVVHPAIFLASGGASFITGASLVVDGGLSVFSHP